jgi:hypothetical protein
MPGPGDRMGASAGDRSRLLASDADRDLAVDVLKAAFVQGRLAKDEFDLHVGQVLQARTYADLDTLTAGVPAGLPLPGQQSCPPASRQRAVPAFVLIAQVACARRRLIFLVTGMLLLVGGMGLGSTVAFISGLLTVALSAPPSLPWTAETASVRTWQWLHRKPEGRS